MAIVPRPGLPRTRPAAVVLGAILLLSTMLLAGCTSTSASPTPAVTATGASIYLAPPRDGPYKIGVSNGNGSDPWIGQMVTELKYAADNVYHDQVSRLTITDANGDVGTQLSQINEFVATGCDILLIDPLSPTALNSGIDRAWAAGIQVVVFNHTVTTTHAITVTEDQVQIGRIGAQWLAKQLRPGDTVVTLAGTPGDPIDDQRLQGATEVLTGAGISIVGSARTDGDFVRAQAAATNLLAQYPDVNGIYSISGNISLGAIQAMQQAGQAVLPIPGEASNGYLKTWQTLSLTQPGFTSVAFSNTPQLLAQALGHAIDARRGNDPGQRPTVDIPIITQDILSQNVRTDLADNFWLPTQLPDSQLKKIYGI